VLAALLALGIGALRVTPRTRAGIAAACLGILASGSLAEIAEPVGTDWRGMARVLDAERQPGEELLVLPDIPLRLLTLRYYYDGRWRQLGQPPEGGQRRAPTRDRARSVWIVLSPHAFAAVRSRDPAAADAARDELRRLRRRFPVHQELPLRSGKLLHLSRNGGGEREAARRSRGRRAPSPWRRRG